MNVNQGSIFMIDKTMILTIFIHPKGAKVAEVVICGERSAHNSQV
jgi:hypothetical protein